MTRHVRFAFPLCLLLVACSGPKVPDDGVDSPDAGGQAIDAGQSEDAGTQVTAPTDLTYEALTPTYTLGQAISPNNPSSMGGAATSFSVEPTLPEGLSLNESSGVLSGTPTKLTPATHYTVTASNEGGFATVELRISVVDVPPAALMYTLASPTYTLNEAITPNAPSSTGGPVVSYAVDPALPAGLALDAETGIISGTPTALSPAATYTVTASNSGGMTTATLVLAVVDLPPTNLVYRPPQLTFRKDIASASNQPSVEGGAVVSFAISPALPAGLSIDSTNGRISGNPPALMSFARFTVTATNSGGSASVDIMIQVIDMWPTGLHYSNADIVATIGQPITDMVPSFQSGPIDGYGLSPSPLPDGLQLDMVTGVISGTPTALSPQTEYTITGWNTGGTSSTVVRITVNDVAPSALTYTADTVTYTVGTPIETNAPSSLGGPVTSYSVMPVLPDGLSLEPSTGLITGTPTTATAMGYYTVTATNTGGSTSTDLTITVEDAVP